MNFKRFGSLLPDNPLCGISTYKDTLNLATGACTRQIRKLVLDGTESWNEYGSGTGRFFYVSLSPTAYNATTVISTHFFSFTSSSTEPYSIVIVNSGSSLRIYDRNTTWADVTAFTTWLQQQYAAGTPVTIWYVLAESTTETTTVPTGLSGTEEGYLTQATTPTPTNPIYPTANEVKVWFDSHYIRKTATDTLTLPAVIYGDGTNATLTLKGNEEHTGTPSPQNPVDVNGTGERTGNLFDISTATFGKYINSEGQEVESIAITAPSKLNHTDYISVISGEPYIYNYVDGVSVSNTIALCWFDAQKVIISRDTLYVSSKTYSLSATAPNNAKYCIINFTGYPVSNSCLTFNLGSEALPYEPYGYKIPISSNSTTYNKYLGEEQTVRRIKKLVLTGEEYCWIYSYSGTNGIGIPNMLDGNYTRVWGVCSHYPVSKLSTTHSVWIGVNNAVLYFVSILDDLGLSTATEFQTYLQQQYAAGTPVTVWYVLATPETAVVNEPLMKIGDYADSLTTSIPTVDGANALSIGTTVQPSEVTAAYHGWHPVQSAHEAENGQWD